MLTIWTAVASAPCLYRGFQRTGWTDGVDPYYYRTSLRNSHKDFLKKSREVTCRRGPRKCEVLSPTIILYPWVAVNHDYNIFRLHFHPFETIVEAVVNSTSSDFAVHCFFVYYFDKRDYVLLILT